AGALELRRRVYGDMHSDVGLAMSELAGVQWRLGRHDEALSTRTRAGEILRQTLGADHPEYAATQRPSTPGPGRQHGGPVRAARSVAAAGRAGRPRNTGADPIPR